MRTLGRLICATAFLAACGSPLPHEGAFDPNAPSEKQAKATLTGVVVLQGEADAANVGVRIENAKRSYSYTTANDGLISQPGIVPGSYTVTVFSRYFSPVTKEIVFSLGETLDLGRVLLPLLTSRVSGSALAQVVSNKQSEFVGGVLLKLTKSASIRGKSAGAPAFRAAATDATESYSSTSAADGSWSIDNVPAGIYDITASHPDAPSADGGTVEVTGDGAVVASEIVLRPLTGFFVIEGDGAAGKSELYTSNADVTLKLSGFNTEKMKVGRSSTGLAAGCVYGAAEIYSAQVSYHINTEGLETVCVRYIDDQGNETGDLLGEIYYDATVPSFASLVINDGALATQTQTVTIRLSASDAKSQSDLGSGLFAYELTDGAAEPSASAWDLVPAFPFVTNTLYTLSGSGSHILWARFQDNAGLWSNPVSSAIDISTVDPVLVSADLQDDGGASVLAGSTTRSGRVYVVSSVTAETTLQMQVSTTGSFTGVDWEPYTASRAIDLAATTGYAKESRTVAARVRDPVGRIIDLIPGRSFYLDTKGPTGTVAVPAVVNLADNDVVPLTFTANDSETIVDIAEDPGFTGSVSFPYQTSYNYTLLAGPDGVRTLYVRFSDAAGNADVQSEDILVDRVAPTAGFSMPGGTLASSNILPVAVAADADTTLMLLSNAADFSGASWQAYQPLFTWIFPAVEGPLTLYGKFSDSAGNISGSFSIGITVDTTPPVVGTVSGAVLSDTLLWDHMGPDVTGYTVKLYNNGQVVSVTNTTEKRLAVGKMGPGFTVIANYADGSQSNPSLPPGYSVPATVAAYIGSQMDAASNRLLFRLASQYGLGTTSATECGQVTFMPQYTYYYGNSSNSNPCSTSSIVKFATADYLQTPPPFYATVVSGSDNPLGGLSGPIRISGGVGGVYGGEGQALLTSDSDVRWPTTSWPQIPAGMVLAKGNAYNPILGRGNNSIEFGAALSAMAMMDDLTYSTSPFSGPVREYDYLEATDYPLTAGLWAAVAADTLTVNEPGWETFLTFNHLWDGVELTQTYNALHPGSIRLPFAVNNGAVSGSVINLSNVYPNRCYYDYVTFTYICEYSGSDYSIDISNSTFTVQHYDPYNYYSYGSIGIANADGSRGYQVPAPSNQELKITWKTETDQPVFLELLQNVLHKLAAPTRVRATGKPVLRSDVADAVAMQISTTNSFTNATWIDYSSEVTLAEGTATVYVRYKDTAGNITTAQEVVISAPSLSPRLDEVALLGAGANPGFSTSPDLTAYFIGSFGTGLRARVSTSPVFEDADWQTLPDPESSISFINPFTGEVEVVQFERSDSVVTQLPVTIPDVEGTYTYWFWLADASDNYSLPMSASVFYDGTAPSAEFSVRPSMQAKSIDVQARWTVTRTSYAPSLTTPAPAAATVYTLPFYFPFNGVTSNTLKFPDAKSACFEIGTLPACALSKLDSVPQRLISQSAQQVTLVWETADFYGVPITAAATLLANGNIRLSYWQTNAKVSMAASVDSVDSPYSDWEYAIATGTVEYAQNSGNIQFVLKSDQGNLVTVQFSNAKKNGGNCNPCAGDPSGGTGNPGGGGNSGPWTTVQVKDKGYTVYTGTAYSLAGQKGRVTVREVTIPSAEYDRNSNLRTVPLTDSKYWLRWDYADDNDSLLYKVAGHLFSPNGVVGGVTSQMPQLSAEQFYNSANYYQGISTILESPLTLRQTATLASAGGAVTPDFEKRLLYGADGSVWDLGNPAVPTPLKVYGGTYAFEAKSPIRYRDYLWTTAGVYSISNPEAPSLVMADPIPPYSDRVLDRGRIYATQNGYLSIYDAARPWVAPATIDFGSVYPNIWLSGQLFARGGHLYNYQYGLAYDFDLSNPDSPTYLTTIPLDSSSHAELQGGNWMVTNDLLRASGSLTVFHDGTNSLGYAHGLPQFYGSPDDGAERGVSLSLEFENLALAGPWIYTAGAGSDMSVLGAGRTWPATGAFKHIESFNQFGIDERYIYVCTQTGKLAVYDLNWNLVTSVSGANCGQGNIEGRYPYVDVGYGRFRFSGNTLVADPVKLCPVTTTYCYDAVKIGSAYTDGSKLWTTPERPIPLSSDNCFVRGADGDMVYCTQGNSQDEIMATTLSGFRYAGVVTGPMTLPLVEIIDDGSSFYSSGNGYVSTYAHTYRVFGLGKVVEIGRGEMKFVGPGLAFNANDRMLYQLTDSGMSPVGKLPLDIYFDSVAVSPLGDLIATQGYSGSVYVTKWGPALPELRYEFDNLVTASSIAEAGGFVYVGDAQGIVRIDPLQRLARSQQRPDVSVRHDNGSWTIRDSGLHALTGLTDTTGIDVNQLCDTALSYAYVHPYDASQNTSRLCVPLVNAPADHIFLGDLGKDWMGVTGFQRDNIGPVSGLASDGQGRIYAAADGGTPGIYMYDGVAGGLSNAGVISVPSGVRDLTAADGRLAYLSYADQLHVVDFSVGATAPLSINVFNGNSLLHVRMLGDYIVYSDIYSLHVVDMSGNPVRTCWNNSTDFQLLSLRWSGSTHLVAALADGTYVRFISLDNDNCQMLSDWTLDQSETIKSLSLSQGLLLVGYANQGLWMLNPANVSKQGMATILTGNNPSAKGVILGNHVYTVGDQKAQIFEIH